MVIMELPDGTAVEYALDDSDPALRLVSRYASFDLRTALTELGWRIRDITTDRERRLLPCLERAEVGYVLHYTTGQG
jgi:hypothetical protein